MDAAAFLYAISILYAINDLDAVTTSNGSFPLAAVYAQATGNNGGTFGLLLIVFFSIMICVVGTFLTVRYMHLKSLNSWLIFTRWVVSGGPWLETMPLPTPAFSLKSTNDLAALCRQPYSAVNSFRSKLLTRLLIVLLAVLCTAFGAIQLGSKTAFTDLVGSFIILTTVSYACAILPHILTRRRNVPPGPFWMGSWGYAINGISVLLIVFFNIMFCFRMSPSIPCPDIPPLLTVYEAYTYPTTTSTMNYNSVILVGVLVLTTAWWFIHARTKYPGPKLSHLYVDGRVVEVGHSLGGSSDKRSE